MIRLRRTRQGGISVPAMYSDPFWTGSSYGATSPISRRRREERRRGRGWATLLVASEAVHPRRKGTGVSTPKPFLDGLSLTCCTPSGRVRQSRVKKGLALGDAFVQGGVENTTQR